MAPRRYSAIWRAVPSAVFSAILPVKPSVDDDVGGALADAVALDEADDIRAAARFIARSSSGRLANLLAALDLLDADIEQADGRPLQSNSTLAMALPITASADQMCAVAADGGAEVEHDRLASQRRPERRRAPAGRCPAASQAEPRHRHQRAGIAGRDRDVGLALLDRVDAPATSTTSSGRGAAPGSACRPCGPPRRYG